MKTEIGKRNEETATMEEASERVWRMLFAKKALRAALRRKTAERADGGILPGERERGMRAYFRSDLGFFPPIL